MRESLYREDGRTPSIYLEDALEGTAPQGIGQKISTPYRVHYRLEVLHGDSLKSYVNSHYIYFVPTTNHPRICVRCRLYALVLARAYKYICKSHFTSSKFEDVPLGGYSEFGLNGTLDFSYVQQKPIVLFYVLHLGLA